MSKKPSKPADRVRALLEETGLSPQKLSYAVRPTQLSPGNQITLLRGGEEAYPAMLDAISKAERTVFLETYILASDAIGQRFAEALRERARHGVTVRLIYDAVGGFGLRREFIARLERDGVRVLAYHPIAPWKARFGVTRRDHRKILVVDDAVGFTGGINISDDYIPPGHGGAGWFDVHCRVCGPIVAELSRLFRRVWINEGGDLYPPVHTRSDASGRTVLTSVAKRDSERAEQPGDRVFDRHTAGRSLARVVDNRQFRQRWKIRRAYLHAINRARHSVDIMNAYFLPDRGIRRALRRARERGVRVRVIVPEHSDVLIIQYAGQHMYGSLLGHGIEILLWPDTMMHAKIAVIDWIWSSVGSYNLDSRSLFYNLEVMVEIIDPAIGQLMREEFERQAARCLPLTLDLWQRRPLFNKVVSWLFYQCRRWL